MCRQVGRQGGEAEKTMALAIGGRSAGDNGSPLQSTKRQAHRLHAPNASTHDMRMGHDG